jgi:glutamate N-acetyltransferase/amino-acid N-acetyltransferase|tara:strand:+ start:222 stop:1523 length:1302 start_codon:yes stop_codon:yes gene_type:complete
MAIHINNFLNSQKKNSKISDFQDLEHIDGVSISTTSAKLYDNNRDDLVLFYFREGANYSSVYTQSQIVSENIKWNLSLKNKKIKALLVNTRNANAFTGMAGFEGLRSIAKELSEQLTIKQELDEDKPKKILPNEIIFGCTGTIGEKFPTEKIKSSLTNLINKIRYTQNKFVWMKAALGIMTTDLSPKIAMEECKIGKTTIKLYGIAKGSGMIFPNMATTLGYIFTDADIPSYILEKLLKKNIETTFNAITCDGDTSTNDMVSIFSTGKAENLPLKNANDIKLKNFDKSLHSLLLSLAKRVVADGEGASKFISVIVKSSKNQEDAKKIAFSIANSSLVKTAVAGEDPNWGRVVMAIGKANIKINLKKLSIKFGLLKVVENGVISNSYNENKTKEYMKEENISIIVDLNMGKKIFTAYTMDLTKKYIEINADYRS